MFVKKGHKNKQVKVVQIYLRRLSFPVETDGVFGPKTESVIRMFQEKYNLNIDGVIGKNTYSTLIKEVYKTYNKSTLNKHIVQAASKYVGQEEISGNLGFKSKVFHKLMVGVGFKRTHPWCAYFTELVWKDAYSSVYGKHSNDIISTTFSASVMKTWNRFDSSELGNRSYVPLPGSLIVFQSSRNRYFGHIGIVKSIDSQNPFYINTIEGNTNDGGGREGYIVAEKVRTLDFKKKNGLNLVGFIHPNIL